MCVSGSPDPHVRPREVGNPSGLLLDYLSLPLTCSHMFPRPTKDGRTCVSEGVSMSVSKHAPCVYTRVDRTEGTRVVTRKPESGVRMYTLTCT